MLPTPPLSDTKPSTGPDTEEIILRPLFLPEVSATVNNPVVYLFFRFCAERHAMYDRRMAGAARDKLTEDETMRSMHIGNVFRELDPGGITIGKNVLNVGEQTVEEVVFRMMLYSMFYKSETWAVLCEAATGDVPSWKTYEHDMPSMEAALYRRSMVEGQKIYYGGFQIVPPTVYFTDDRNRTKSMHHYAASLRLVLAVMNAGLPAMLEQCRYAVDASNVLQTLPTYGGFLSLNVLCLLNETPHFNWPYRTFATCGPGSRYCMQRMFGKEVINSVAMEEAGLRWLADNQWRYWARLGIDPPHATDISGMRPGMRVLDVENALCWCHRYIAAYEKAPHMRSFADVPPPVFDTDVTEAANEPAWCVDESNVQDWDLFNEASARIGHVDEDEDVYEVEKIVGRSGNRSDRDGFFRVRWRGWAPEEDTWERGSVLKDGSEEALNEWLDWEKRVWDAIAYVKEHKRFTKPERSSVKAEDASESDRSSKRRKTRASARPGGAT